MSRGWVGPSVAHNSEIPAVKQSDTSLMSSDIFIKIQLQKLNGERKEKRLGGAFCGALYNREIPAVKKLDMLLMSYIY